MPFSASNKDFVNRRRVPRTPSKMAITLVVEADGRDVGHSASTVDFSNLGARIRARVGLTGGQAVRIIVYERKREAVPCRVVWVGEAQAHGYREAGLEFLAPFE